MTNWLGLPALASAQGAPIDSLISWVHIFMFALFAGWGGFLTFTLIRFRRSRHPVANYAGARTHSSSYLEIGVAVVEGILLFGFSIPLWAARVDRMPPENEALVVEVTGEQFAWNVHYAGPDGVFGRGDIKLMDPQSNPLGIDRKIPGAKDDITTLNQLYLPVGRPIIVKLRSKDVIHSFNVPEFRVKQDAYFRHKPPDRRALRLEYDGCGYRVHVGESSPDARDGDLLLVDRYGHVTKVVERHGRRPGPGSR